MRLRVVKIMPIAFVAMLSSCQLVEVAESGISDGVEMSLFDLQEFTYKDVKELLGNKEKVTNICFQDGEIIRNVKKLQVKTGLELGGDDDQAAQTVFFEGAPEDSISVIMDGTYASVKMIKDGKELGYVAFVDPIDATLAASKYEKYYAQTRTTDAALPLTRDAGRNVLRLDLTEMGRTSQSYQCENLPVMEESTMSEESPNVPTRTAYYTQWPRGNTFTIHLVRDAGDTPWEYELNWQVDEVVASIRNISYTNVKVWRSSTGYRSDKRDVHDALRKFVSYCRSNSFPWKEAAGHDAIVLVTHYAYNNAAGSAYLNSYRLKRYNNSLAYGIAATSAVNCTRTLAHEVGHMLGANHVATRPWWQFWLKDDVMVPVSSWNTSYQHFDGNNRDKIWDNLNK